MQDYRCKITEYRFKIAKYRCKITEYRCKITEFRCKITEYRCKIAEYRIQNTGYQEFAIQNPENQLFVLVPITRKEIDMEIKEGKCNVKMP